MKTLIVQDKNQVRTITLNRPDVHNAFNSEMIEELTSTFRNIGANRVVVIRGEGKSFCAGADLNWMKSMVDFTLEENRQDSEKLFDMYDAIAKCPVPVISKVHGSVFGGGVGLVAVSDIAVAALETKFCFSEAKLGLVPAVISAFVLKKVDQGFARQMMLTAQVFDERRALNCNLIHFVGQGEEIDDYIQSQIDFILANGPEAIKSIKHLLDFVPEHDWKSVRAETAKIISQRRVSAEGQEGMKAFFEKRKPSWKA